MIPDFTENGRLPLGIHRATWDEFAERFVTFQRSDHRLRLGERIQSLYDEVRSSGIVRRFIIAGSYVTSKSEPNDFDCLLVLDPAIMEVSLAPFEYNVISQRIIRRRFKGDIFTAFDHSEPLREYLAFFQTARDGQQVGIVEIEL
jgi:hypothetical protein